jgi:hypothetical protein
MVVLVNTKLFVNYVMCFLAFILSSIFPQLLCKLHLRRIFCSAAKNDIKTRIFLLGQEMLRRYFSEIWATFLLGLCFRNVAAHKSFPMVEERLKIIAIQICSPEFKTRKCKNQKEIAAVRWAYELCGQRR